MTKQLQKETSRDVNKFKTKISRNRSRGILDLSKIVIEKLSFGFTIRRKLNQVINTVLNKTSNRSKPRIHTIFIKTSIVVE